MDRYIENFQNLARACHLSAPIPAPIQDHAIRSGRENLARTLKQAGLAGAGMIYILWFFRVLRNAGMKATLLQAKVVSSVVAVHLAAAVGISGLTAIRIATAPEARTILEGSASALPGIISGSLFTKKYPGRSAVAAQDAIGITPFTGADGPLAADITALFARTLSRKLGHDRVVPVASGNRNAVNRLVMGSVRILGNETIITVKVIEVKTSKVSIIASRTISSADEMDDACEALADELVGFMKKN